MYDCAIVGTGPAGLSAALNLKLHNKSIIWFGSKELSNKISNAESIANYPGFPYISGNDLRNAFCDHIEKMNIEITDAMVTMISSAGNIFMLLADNQVYKAKSVILATGVVSTRLLNNEDAFVGRGLSYCATCDGFLYNGKTIAVLCKSKRFEHEILYLAELAEKVYLFTEYDDCSVNAPNVVLQKAKCTGVSGSLKVNMLTLSDGTELAVDGLFVLRDAIAPATLLPGLEVCKGQIVADRTMATNIPGCFACGDCTGAPYQYAKAIGEGNVAAHSIIRYLVNM